LALPVGVKHWSMTTLREKLIKIGAKVVHHARSVVFQMAEVAVPRKVFRLILVLAIGKGMIYITSPSLEKCSASSWSESDDFGRRWRHQDDDV